MKEFCVKELCVKTLCVKEPCMCVCDSLRVKELRVKFYV